MAKPPAVTRRGWPKGINNLANGHDLTPDTLRDAINFDPSTSGTLSLRAGYEEVYRGQAVRGCLASGRYLLVADEAELVCVDEQAGSHRVLAPIDAAGRFVGAELNGELFFCTETQAMRFKDGSLRRWGVPTVNLQPLPVVGAGGMLAGLYQLAVTYTDERGDEGGTTTPLSFQLQAGSGISVSLTAPAGCTPNLYLSPADGDTLYLQASGVGTHVLTTVLDNTRRLVTAHLTAVVPGDIIEAHNAVLAIAEGSTLRLTEPMSPHLCRPLARFFSYPAKIGMLLSAGGGLVVSADKTYLITDVETDTPQQRELFPFPAVAGTGTSLPAGGGAWMTPYGLATLTDQVQGAKLLSAAQFAPGLADSGRSGIVEHNGAQLVVTTARPGQGRTPLIASDYYEVEIVSP